MPKSKFKIKNKSIVRKPTNPFANPRFDQIRYPSIPSHIREQFGLEMAKRASTDFPENMQKLHSAILQSSPLALICSMTNHALTAFDGVSKKHTAFESILQPHVELVQSIALKHKFEEFKRRDVDIAPILKLAELVFVQFSQKRLGGLISASADEVRGRLELLETARLMTQGVRNWGYPQHMRAILRGLFEQLDAELERRFGVKGSTCVDLIFMLVRLNEYRTTEFQQSRMAFFAKKNKSEMFEEYKSRFSFDPILDISKTFVADPNVSLEQFRNHLIVASDQFLPSEYFVSVSDIRNLCDGENLSEETITSLLDKWSLEFGGISMSDEFLFMGSPIRSKPFIKLSDDSQNVAYVLPIPGLLISFATEMIEVLAKELGQKYFERRARFLEEELERLVKESFPDAAIFTGSYWNADKDSATYKAGARCENDCLLLVDEFAIVFEAKSGRIDDSAKRGGNRLFDVEVDALMKAPAEQAANFAEYLSRNRGLHKFETSRGFINEVDTTNVRFFIPIAVTLDDLPIREGWNALKAAGVVNDDFPSVPVYNLADLMVVFDILSDVAQRLHYLYRRSQLPSSFNYVGDEVDLLTLYLKTRLRLETPIGTKYDGSRDAAVFDKYYLKTYEGIEETKPLMPLTDRWEWLLKNAPSTGPGWSNVSNMLLNCTFAQQEDLEKRILKVSKIVKTKKTNNYIYFENKFAKPSEVLVVLVHGELSDEDRRTLLANGVQNAFEMKNHNEVDLIVGISVDAKRLDIPYRSMIWSRKSEGNESVHVCIPN